MTPECLLLLGAGLLLLLATVLVGVDDVTLRESLVGPPLAGLRLVLGLAVVQALLLRLHHLRSEVLHGVGRLHLRLHEVHVLLRLVHLLVDAVVVRVGLGHVDLLGSLGVGVGSGLVLVL